MAKLIEIDAFLRGKGIMSKDHAVDRIDHTLAYFGRERCVATLWLFQTSGGGE